MHNGGDDVVIDVGGDDNDAVDGNPADAVTFLFLFSGVRRN